MCLGAFCGVDGNAEDAGNHDKRANPLHCGKGWVVGSQAANVQDAQYNPDEERAPEGVHTVARHAQCGAAHGVSLIPERKGLHCKQT